ncbi:SlyX family protein [Aestuariispira insulae]|uniref:SlyX protein n=1 Tax=Aestuariispira insulae TaxID=1461337 RepID=A0A3D9HV73_9PROT|nr:SlyX family protein [Aestuariispira insulae]RED53339.1 SlyX protein [Aestuariispira insulae]
MSEDRLNTLEIHVAELERTVADMSDMISDQWKVIDALKGRVKLLTQQMEDAEFSQRKNLPEPPPPHY